MSTFNLTELIRVNLKSYKCFLNTRLRVFEVRLTFLSLTMLKIIKLNSNALKEF